MLVAKVKRSVHLVLHAPSVSVGLAPRSPVALTVPVASTAHVAKVAVVMVTAPASLTVPVVMVIAPASQTVPVVKIAEKEVVVRVIVRASLTAHAVKIAAKEAALRKKMKGDCGLLIASATAMKRGVNILGISALSISRPSLEVAMSSH